MENHTLTNIGLVVFMIGLFIFLIGTKFPRLRAYFGDKSMFRQIFLGIVIAGVGIILIGLGAFNLTKVLPMDLKKSISDKLMIYCFLIGLPAVTKVRKESQEINLGYYIYQDLFSFKPKSNGQKNWKITKLILFYRI